MHITITNLPKYLQALNPNKVVRISKTLNTQRIKKIISLLVTNKNSVIRKATQNLEITLNSTYLKVKVAHLSSKVIRKGKVVGLIPMPKLHLISRKITEQIYQVVKVDKGAEVLIYLRALITRKMYKLCRKQRDSLKKVKRKDHLDLVREIDLTAESTTRLRRLTIFDAYTKTQIGMQN